ncbi:MAG TPA: hypothetical protein EYG51_10815 [Pseudomonadales bacterium]|nr:hypothetical protein [Pseudomonadales bacterium]
MTVQKIARELNVTHILEGSVRKARNSVRITAQLIDAETGVHLWSNTYDRELENVFAVQDEISRATVAEIDSLVGGSSSVQHLADGQGVTTLRVANQQAYDMYLRASQQERRTDPSHTEAVSMFRQATFLDPEFADAWVGLALALEERFEGKTPKEVYPEQITALERALNLEPQHALAMAHLGFLRAHTGYEWRAGYELMEQAYQLNPQNAQVLRILSDHLAFTSKPESIAMIEQAYRLDPLSPDVVLAYADALRVSGRQRDAQQLIEGFMATGSGGLDTRQASFFFLQAGDLDLAQQYQTKSQLIWGVDDSLVLQNEYMLVGRQGNEARAKEIETILLERMEHELVIYNYWGSTDTIKRRFDLAYAQRQPHFIQSVRASDPASGFSEDEWRELRGKMNVHALGDIGLLPFRQRTDNVIDNLLTHPVEVDVSSLDKFVGTYESSGFTTLTFEVKEGDLWISTSEVSSLRTVAISSSRFELLEFTGFNYYFVTDPNHDLVAMDGQITRYYKRVVEH